MRKGRTPVTPSSPQVKQSDESYFCLTGGTTTTPPPRRSRDSTHTESSREFRLLHTVVVFIKGRRSRRIQKFREREENRQKGVCHRYTQLIIARVDCLLLYFVCRRHNVSPISCPGILSLCLDTGVGPSPRIGT